MARYLFDRSATPWHEWPTLSVCWDQESVNLTSAHFLQYKVGACADIVYDAAHGAWNDIKGAARECALFPMLMSLMLVWNLPHGPWADDVRWSQVRELLDEVTAQPWHEVPPLISARGYDMIREAEAEHLVTEGTPIENFWRQFCDMDAFATKGGKVSLNRWMSISIQGKKDIGIWSARLACYEMVALKCDWLTEKVGR